MAAEEEQPTNKKQPSGLDDKIEEALLKTRRIFFSDAVDDKSANEVIRKLWYLELQNPGKPILLVINSPGGSVDSGFAILDQVKMISSPVSTLVTGLAASMATIIMQCAPKGKRFATPNARIMIHQPKIMGVIQGQATDLAIQAKEIIKTRKRIVNVYVNATGKDERTIEKAIDRDTWYTVQEAISENLIDEEINSFDQLVI